MINCLQRVRQPRSPPLYTRLAPQAGQTPAQQPQQGNCGVNPIGGEPGFTRNPINGVGNLRSDRNGRGQYGASRGGGKRKHTGLDIAGELNTTPIVAFLAGTVVFAGSKKDYGTTVIVEHANGLQSQYSHLQVGSVRGAGITPGVDTEQAVTQGQQIGTLGNTGNAGRSTPHVHFEVRVNGERRNPATILNNPCPE